MILEYEPVYNLLDKYEYVVLLAREPAITEPFALTREAVDVALRARTARFAVVVRLVAALLRDVTLREGVFVERFGVIARDDTVLFVEFPRVAVVLFDEDAAGLATVVRATFARLLFALRGL